MWIWKCVSKAEVEVLEEVQVALEMKASKGVEESFQVQTQEEHNSYISAS